MSRLSFALFVLLVCVTGQSATTDHHEDPIVAAKQKEFEERSAVITAKQIEFEKQTAENVQKFIDKTNEINADLLQQDQDIKMLNQTARNFQKFVDGLKKIKDEMDRLEQREIPRWRQAIDYTRKILGLIDEDEEMAAIQSKMSRLADQLIQEQLHANSSKEM
jgi:hypothetical protein